MNSPERSSEPAEETSHDFSNASRLLHSVEDHARPSAIGRSLFLVIENTRWIGFELRDLWVHRELFYFLVWRDIKIRYQQTVLGASWAILQPLISMIVLPCSLAELAHVPSEGQPYAIFSYAGLLPWNFFTTAVTSGSNSLVNSTNLITKVYFPRTARADGGGRSGFGGHLDSLDNAIWRLCPSMACFARKPRSC